MGAFFYEKFKLSERCHALQSVHHLLLRDVAPRQAVGDAVDLRFVHQAELLHALEDLVNVAEAGEYLDELRPVRRGELVGSCSS